MRERFDKEIKRQRHRLGSTNIKIVANSRFTGFSDRLRDYSIGFPLLVNSHSLSHGLVCLQSEWIEIKLISEKVSLIGNYKNTNTFCPCSQCTGKKLSKLLAVCQQTTKQPVKFSPFFLQYIEGMWSPSYNNLSQLEP